jgi:hypothetical protein
VKDSDPTRELTPEYESARPQSVEDWRAIEEVDPDALNELQKRMGRRLAEMELAVPAVIALESSKPVTFIVSQALAAGEPILYWLSGLQDYYTFRKLMEDRDQVENLIQQIEAAHDERREQLLEEKAEQRERKARRKAAKKRLREWKRARKRRGAGLD